jgi:hypothetical protein
MSANNKMIATPEEIEDILTLDSFKKEQKYPGTNFNSSKIYYFEIGWRRKPKSVKEEKYKNMELTDLRWGKGGKFLGKRH